MLRNVLAILICLFGTISLKAFSPKNQFLPPKMIFNENPAYSPMEFGTNWIRTYGSNDAPSQEEPYKIVRDNLGNLIVCGFSTSQDFGTDPLVVKFDPNGNLLWSARYTGNVQGNNEALDIAVDSNNDIYITGNVWGAGSYYDIFTVKFSASGQQLWSKTFNGSLNGWDEAGAITIDSNDNIYITGAAAALDLTYDLVVIKYDSQGNELWNYIFDGGTGGWVWGHDILADGSGNIYVASLYYNGTSYDLSLLKLNASGNFVWESSYDNSGNDENGLSLNLTSGGDIVVCGAGYVGGGYNYLLVSFDSQGNVNWNAYHAGKNDQNPSMTIDGSDNIYIAGSIRIGSTDDDFLILKYDNAANLVWEETYDGGENRYDAAAAVTTDGSGNVFVGGYQSFVDSSFTYIYQIVLVSLDSSGTFLWSAVPNNLGTYSYASDILLDQSGNAVLAGMDAYPRDIDLSSFNSNGNQIFHSSFDGNWGSFDRANDFVVSSTGDVIIGGTGSTQNSSDFLTIKYDANGNFKWKARYNGASNLIDIIWAVDVDNNGNVYVTGSSEVTANIRDIVTIKYDPNGNLIWEKIFDGSLQLNDIPVDIKVNDQGDVYVCGYSDVNTSYSRKVILLKYSSSGSPLWERSFKGSYPDGNDQPIKMELDSQGDIYVAARLIEDNNGDINTDYALAKFSQNGDSLWINKYNGTGNDHDYLNDLHIGSQGNIYITGHSKNQAGDYEIVTIKYNPSGVEQWVAEYDSSYGGLYGNQGGKLITDGNGNLFVGGIAFVSSYDTDILIIKYNSAGVRQWVTQYSNPDRVDAGDRINGMQLMDDGSIFIASSFSSAWPSYSLQNLKFSPDGVIENIDPFQLLTSPSEVLITAIGAEKSPNGNIIVVGNSQSTYWSAITTLSYSNSATGIDDVLAYAPESFQLDQNYPNPFNPTTNLRFTIADFGYTELKIFDLLGREIKTLVKENLIPGNYEKEWDGTNNAGQPVASGVYLYRLKTKGFVQTRKMVLLR